MHLDDIGIVDGLLVAIFSLLLALELAAVLVLGAGVGDGHVEQAVIEAEEAAA